MTIYVVTGSVGEYSDRCEWVAAAFRSEARAQAVVVEWDQKGREIAERLRRSARGYARPEYATTLREHPDPQFSIMGDDPATYTVCEVELSEEGES